MYYKKPQTVEQHFENVKHQYESFLQYYQDPALLKEAGIKVELMSEDCKALAAAISREGLKEEKKD